MTFKETDFPALIKFLKTFVNEEADPMLIKEVLLQFIKLYEDVPLYPGIVNMCVGRVYKTVPPEEVQIGQKAFIQNGDDCFVGTVVSRDEDGVTLRGVKSLTSDDEIEIGFKEMKKVQLINEKVLEELWPSLVFEKGKSR
ncbi:MAG: hypothetical protein HQM09_18730 [Candidatus Riflebacteria bacterium]|nr:hypothetical protein [Candidatus Riflebacteria bacterium]